MLVSISTTLLLVLMSKKPVCDGVHNVATSHPGFPPMAVEDVSDDKHASHGVSTNLGLAQLCVQAEAEATKDGEVKLVAAKDGEVAADPAFLTLTESIA